MKKIARFSVKMSEEERGAIADAARGAGVTVSEYIRRRTLADRTSAAVSPTTALQVYTVDSLGPDPLRADNGALVR